MLYAHWFTKEIVLFDLINLLAEIWHTIAQGIVS